MTTEKERLIYNQNSVLKHIQQTAITDDHWIP